MDFKSFAESILFGSSLADKLLHPRSFRQDAAETAARAPVAVPTEPGRPRELQLPKPRQKASQKFPSLASLEQERARGVVLHYFANHELLALELMALALLRFPDAPLRWRQGLVGTMVEEQKHLGLYHDRMRALGVEFGEIQVSRFFWDAIAHTPSADAFVAQMSLTLEQANLDFAKRYQGLFASVGDHETAAILDIVYREEIGHVAHGVAWMQRWCPPGDSLWDFYQRSLPPPLTPARAKGEGGVLAHFDVDGRRAAGLPDAFIEDLRVFSHSKGRPPNVFYFNPTVEDELASGARSYVPSSATASVREDLAALMGFLAKSDDAVVVPRLPSTEHLAQLQQAGFVIPRFLPSDRRSGVPAPLPFDKIEALLPWGNSPRMHRIASAVKPRPRQPLKEPLAEDTRWFSKAWSALRHQELSPETATSVVCKSEAETDSTLRRLAEDGHATAVVKAPLGSSGRHMQRARACVLDDKQRQWLLRVLQAQGAVVVEPWLNRVADLSMQLQVDADGVSFLGVTRFFTDERGQYLGHALAGSKLGLAVDQSLPPGSLERLLYQDGGFATLESLALRLGAKLRDEGFRGPVGIDALVHAKASAPASLRLRPLVEVNPRFTMGRIALQLEKRVAAGRPALWLHVSQSRLEQARAVLEGAGYAPLGELRELEGAARRMHPLVLARGLVSEGVVATTDPSQARRLLTLLFVGESVERLGLPLLRARSHLQESAPTDR